MQPPMPPGQKALVLFVWFLQEKKNIPYRQKQIN